MAGNAIPEVFSGKFGCGHEGEVSLTNVPVAKRFSRVDWLSTKGKCRECFAKDGQKRLEKENKASAAWASEQGLPGLRGSAKQVGFGEQRRQGLVQDAYAALVAEGDWDDAAFEKGVLEPAQLVTAAHWWIEAGESEDASVLPELLEKSEPMRARAWEQRVNAAPIVGTSKQEDWGRRVRFEKVEAARETLDAQVFAQHVEEPAARINSAHWWIDISSAPVEALVDLLESAGDDAYIENVEE